MSKIEKNNSHKNPNKKLVFQLCLTAFLIIVYLVYSRSLSKAYFLSIFEAKQLSYVYLFTPLLGLPVMSLFIHFLGKQSNRKVMFHYSLLFSAAILINALLLRWVDQDQTLYKICVLIYYFIQTLGLMVLTSGFWILTSNYFPLREAKKTYSLIAAGGTAGAMFAGNTVKLINTYAGIVNFNFILIIILILLAGLYYFLPEISKENATHKENEKTSVFESLHLIFRHRHLRLISGVIMIATFASTLLNFELDYQVDLNFTQQNLAKEIVKEKISNFFGLYYGWTGAFSLILQIFLVGHLISKVGVGPSLSILPFGLFFGSVIFIFFPSLLVITLLRGFDNTLRKSLHRSVIEILYIPVSTKLRRKTKGIIDSILDSGAESFAAIIIMMWVNYMNYNPVHLIYFVLAALLIFIFFNRLMQKQYVESVVTKLKDGSENLNSQQIENINKLNFNILNPIAENFFAEMSPSLEDNEPKSKGPRDNVDVENQSLLERLTQKAQVSERDFSELIKLLVKDDLEQEVVKAIASLGNAVIPQIITIMHNQDSDFVIQRRLPQLLINADSEEVYLALLEALKNQRFEVRYRTAIALRKRRQKMLDVNFIEYDDLIWQAIRFELQQSKPVWELHRLLDEKPEEDDLIFDQVSVRGKLSLEHVFRMLTLVLDEENVLMAYYGTLLKDEKLRSLALEYLELVLPKDVKDKIWTVLGEFNEFRRNVEKREIKNVVNDLVDRGNTLISNPDLKNKLDQIIKKNHAG